MNDKKTDKKPPEVTDTTKPEKDTGDQLSEPGTAPLVTGHDPDKLSIVSAPEEEPDSNIDPDKPEAAEPEDTDPLTDKVVDEIVAKEGDELLADEDEKIAKAIEPETKQGWRQKIKEFFVAWWNNPKARWATIAILALLFIVLAAWPSSRYFMLNTVGVRASASLQVLDSSTSQPLKNVEVTIANKTGKTDDDGKIKLDRIKLGKTKLTVKKRAFADITKNITVGFGSNPLGEFNVDPTGVQYTFFARDFLSDKPVTNAEAYSGDANAKADEEGKIVLTIDSSDEELEVTIAGPSYREEKLTLSLNDTTTRNVKMVPSRKHAFVSKRSGKYDVYSIDVDGKNEKVIFKGTGYERDDVTLIPHPTDNMLALVSTRDNNHNTDGFLLSGLNLINADTGESEFLGESEKIQIVDWIGNRLVYVQISAGSSAANPKRERLISYDYKSKTKDELASGNYFNYVTVANGKIYYAPSSAYQPTAASVFSVNADATDRKTVLNQEAWNIFRTQYDKLNLSTNQGWYEYVLGDAQAAKISGAPASLRNRLYQDNVDGIRSLWVDSRDGKGVLLVYDRNTKQDKVIMSKSGLTSPVYWLGLDYIVYRVQNDQETADFVLNLNGGESRKISDVSAIRSVGGWYY